MKSWWNIFCIFLSKSFVIAEIVVKIFFPFFSFWYIFDINRWISFIWFRNISLRMKNRNVFCFLALTLQIFFTSRWGYVLWVIVPFELLYNDSCVFFFFLVYLLIDDFTYIYLILLRELLFCCKIFKYKKSWWNVLFFFFFCFSILITFQIFSTSDVEAPSDQIIVSLVASVIVKISRIFDFLSCTFGNCTISRDIAN